MQTLLNNQGGGMMQTLLQQKAKQVSTACSSLKTDVQISLKCNYKPEDDILLAPDHCHFQNVAVAHDVRKTEHESLLDVNIDIHRVNHERLHNAVVSVVIQDTFGTKLLQWESEAIDQVNLIDSGISYLMSMAMSMPVQCSALKQMKEMGPCRLQFILEDENGNILDDAAGQIVIEG